MTVEQLGTFNNITINKNGTLYSGTPNLVADLEDLLAFSLGAQSNLVIDASKLTQNNVATSVTLTLGKDLDSDGELDDNEIITSRFLSETATKQEVLNLDLAAGNYLVELAVTGASTAFELSYFTEFAATTIREEWIEQLGTSSADYSQGVTTDSNGNVYLSGYTYGSLGGTNTGGYDAWVGKYDTQGNLLWKKQLGTNSHDYSRGVATDGNGNVYLSGHSSTYAWVAKYDTEGNLNWKKNLSSSGSNSSRGVATDSNGNVYISGITSGSLEGTNAGLNDAWVAKYNSQGSLLWKKQLGTSDYDYSNGVATDSNGNVYLSGHTRGSLEGTNAGSYDAWVTKYDSQGNLLWTQQFGTTSNDESHGVVTDSNGNVYLSGYTSGNLDGINAGSNDAWVAKYNSQGNLLWTRQLGTSSDDRSYGVAIDSNNSVYLSGYTQGSIEGTNAGSNDAWVAKYDSQGNLLWTEQLGTSSADYSNGVATDSNNSVYLSGYTYGSLDGTNAGSLDAWVTKISQPTTNKAPYLVNPIAAQSTNANEFYSLTLSSYTFLDLEDGNNLTYSATLANGSSLPSWLSFNSNTRTFSGTPNQGGTLDIKVTATDSGGATDEDFFQIQVIDVNDAPTLVNPIPDRVAIEDSAFYFTFGSNTFNDVDAGDSLTYNATLTNGSALPSWLNFNPYNRTFSGIPGNENVGTLSIRLTATDNDSESVSDIFALQVLNVNDAPTLANPITNRVAIEDTAFYFTFAANTFNDVDAGDSLTYSATLTNGSALPSWLNFNPDTRTFSGTPGNENVGTLSIRLTATDNNNKSVSDTFALQVWNVSDAPTLANPISNRVAIEDSAFNFTFAANTFNDVDAADSLTYTATLANGSALPSWLHFNPDTRTFSGTPGNDNVGTLDIRLT